MGPVTFLRPPEQTQYRDFVMSVSFPLSVRAYLRNYRELQVQYSPYFCARRSVLLWRRCDTLCTSGSVDDVTFERSGSYTETSRYRCGE